MNLSISAVEPKTNGICCAVWDLMYIQDTNSNDSDLVAVFLNLYEYPVTGVQAMLTLTSYQRQDAR